MANFKISRDLSKFRKPSRYIDREINVIKKQDAEVRVVLAFPDTYEIGMSHLGLKILYDIINSIPYASAERVFAPWTDLRRYYRDEGLNLISLESSTPLKNFHIVGFSLQYELSYATVLEMLSLGGISIMTEERGEETPIVIAGGPSTVNPAPLLPFIDAFLVGDGEEAVLELLELCKGWIKGETRKEETLKRLSEIEGFYLPKYSKTPVKRRFIKDFDNTPFPVSPIVPYMQIVHDRIMIEISRGCTQGCRFCQAGMVYRPLRERTPERILKLIEQSLLSTGHDEVSLSSLSAGDYTHLLSLMRSFNRIFSSRKISLSLPSLRVSAVNRDILREIKSVKKSGFTVAPEAATERLRRVINKDFNEEDYERALHSLFIEGWLNLKLYFMIGLPTEHAEDIEAITEMAMQALKISKRYTSRFINLTVSISPFVPKPHTPFQWIGQESVNALEEKVNFLKGWFTKKKITLKVHNVKMSLLEAALSRGGKECAKALKEYHLLGGYLDGWSENFDFSLWEKAMERSGLDLNEVSQRNFSNLDPLPWDFVDVGVKKKYLHTEYERSLGMEWTSDCNRDRCHACGLGCKTGEYLASLNIKYRPYRQEPIHKFTSVKIRVVYTKKGDLKYLSHLELVNAILRGLRRAGVPIIYSVGFCPLPKVSFGPPLSVGVEGENEYLDMEVYPPVDRESFAAKINKHMPEGLKVKEMEFIHKKVPSLSSFIMMYEYEIYFKVNKAVRPSFLKSEIQNPKSEPNMSDFIEKLDIIDNKSLRLRVKDLPNRKVKFMNILDSLFSPSFEDMEIIRTGLFGWKDRWIDPMELVRSKVRSEK